MMGTHAGSVVGAASRAEDELITIRIRGVDQALETPAAALCNVSERYGLVSDLHWA
jgi:hypothetical protein